MSEIKFDSVFADNVNDEKAFDTIFGAEEDNELIDLACGLKEDGSANLPDFEELHQVEDDKTDRKDLEDELGPDNETNNQPKIDPTDQDVIKKEDDKPIDACPQCGVADATEAKPSVDPENIEDAADKAADKVEAEIQKESAALRSLLEEAEEDLAPAAAEDQPADAEVNDANDPTPPEADQENPGQSEACKKEGCCKKEDGSEEDDDDDDDDEKSEVDKIEEEIDEEEEAEEAPKSEEPEKEEEPAEAPAEETKDEDEDSVDEAATEEEAKEEAIEDEIIDTVEDDSKMAASDANEIADVYDDDLIDMVAGE